MCRMDFESAASAIPALRPRLNKPIVLNHLLQDRQTGALHGLSAVHLDSGEKRTNIQGMKAPPHSGASPCSESMTGRRNDCAPRPGRRSPSIARNRRRLSLYVFVMALSLTPCYAQKQPFSGLGAYRRTGKFPERVYGSTAKTDSAANEEQCFPWNLSDVRGATVSVSSLKVPSNARHEYDKACDASNQNKFAEAEQHARSAIDKFQNYSAAWVMLGIIFEEQRREQSAQDACTHAAAIDANYLPAYLCGAEFSVRSREWKQALDWADQALSLKSDGDAYPYYYRAMAYLHLNNLAEAKQNALHATAIDVNHDEPSLSLLLAEIYGREGDNASAIDQLQQLLKRHTDPRQENTAKRFLAKLESQQATK
jgi:Tfp pilus assembly protein PilF